MIVGLTPNGSERLRSWLKKDALATYMKWKLAGEQHHEGYRPVRQGQHTQQGGELVANIIHDEVLVDQQSMRLQMEVHTPQQHKNAKVKWLNSKNFLAKPTEN
ncbi:hypothetical protein E4U61_003036 [Claviceps capensis]|nr:hypothetical protein E4U61_003036 [Claviceps capensis]